MTYLSYRDAGVDIEAGNSLVKAIQPLAKDTQRSGCDASLGGFGALFDIKAAGFRDPILVSGTDGVGTKLKVWEVILHQLCLCIYILYVVNNQISLGV